MTLLNPDFAVSKERVSAFIITMELLFKKPFRIDLGTINDYQSPDYIYGK